MADNFNHSVGCLVVRNREVLLVRHTYGRARGKLLIPGGYLQEGEMPEQAADPLPAGDAVFPCRLVCHFPAGLPWG